MLSKEPVLDFFKKLKYHLHMKFIKSIIGFQKNQNHPNHLFGIETNKKKL